MKRQVFILVLCLLILAGCKKKKSEDVDPDHIQQEIWYIYDGDNLDSYFGIRFYDTDWYRRVILDPPCSITLNGNQMILNTINSFYESLYDNEQVPAGTFVYTDIWKRVYTNTADLQKSIELPAMDTLYKNKDNIITWIGDPITSSSESVIIHVGILLPIATVTTNQAGATSITIKKGELSLWNSEASIRVRIDRETTSPLQQGTEAGGKIITKYKSVIKRVYIK
jgi:hypothetical protein